MQFPFDASLLRAWYGDTLFAEGERDHAQESVITCYAEVETPREVTLRGMVVGVDRRPHAVTLRFQRDTGGFRSRCSCPHGTFCRHAVALGLAYLHDRERAFGAAGWRERLEAYDALLGGSPGESTALSYAVKADALPPHHPEGTHALFVIAGRGVGDDFEPILWPRLAFTPTPDPADKLILAELRRLVDRTFDRTTGTAWRDRPFWLPVEGAVLDTLMRLLALSGRLEDAEGRRVAVRAAEPLRWTLSLERTDAGARLTPTLVGPTGPAAPAAVVGTQRAWALVGDAWHPIEGVRPEAGLIEIPASDLAAFDRRFLPRLAVKGAISGPDAPADPRVTAEAPVGQLVLEQDGERLLVRPGFLYGGVRVEAFEPGELAGPPSGPWHRRDPRAERDLVWPLSLPQATGTLAFGGDEAVEWVAKKLPGLMKAGWTAVGQDALDGFRLVGKRPKTSVVVSSGVDWFDVEATVSVGDEPVPWPALMDALSENRRYVRLGDGRHAKLPAEWLKRQAGLLMKLGGTEGRTRAARHQAPMLERLIERADHAQLDKGYKAFAEKLKTFGGIRSAPLPRGLQGELRPYQRQGLNFLSFLRDYGLHGILADDMGLGKTIQAIALLAANAPKAKAPSLIVAPTSLVANWQSELSRFAPGLRVRVLHGPGRDASALQGVDVVLTTYATARLDLAHHLTRTYHTLILDESQAIKNPLAQTARAMRELRATHRLCLTGTPIENNLVELWSQFAFLMPGLLGELADFKSRFATPIAHGDAEARAEFKAMVGPFILRRLKREVATELPPRTDIVSWVELEPAQRRVYEAVLVEGRERVQRAVAEKGLERSAITILDALLKMRQACCHPALLKTPGTMAMDSAKVHAFLELVDELQAGGHRALVFSQFTSMLAILKERLDAKGVAYEYLDGRTKDRQARVERFNAGDAPLFLISLKAGGTGLNLTGADYVIHFDPWWNPAVEDQATDRAHRIGQTRQVFNYKLIARGTIEEKLLALQAKKRELVAGLLDAESFGKRLSQDDLAFLFEA